MSAAAVDLSVRFQPPAGLEQAEAELLGYYAAGGRDGTPEAERLAQALSRSQAATTGGDR